MRRLSRLVEAGTLMPVDAELGALLTRRAAAKLGSVEGARLIGFAGAMLSAERARGHSCLDLDVLASAAAPYADLMGRALPTIDSWRTLLAESGLCGDGAAVLPLVIDGGRIYLHRYHAAECRLAAGIGSRLAASNDTEPDAACINLFRRLFPDAGTTTDWQAAAAAVALRGTMTVITGGPGTGKTTTVARILALLVQRTPDIRIALAAPTGKAAARLVESVRTGAAKMQLDSNVLARIPSEGKTLHRLLGYRPSNDQFAHGIDDPLAEDVVVIDEASMVDVLMMDALFAALRPSTRIILLGDQDQLASVDTGFVLGDICRAADRCGDVHGAGLAGWMKALCGSALESRADVPPLRDAVVRLRRSYRFASQPGIGAMAEAIRSGRLDAVSSVLADEAQSDVRLATANSTAELLEPLWFLLDDYLDSASPNEALERFAKFRVLCAVRDGHTGVSGLNERIEAWLRTRGIPTRARWYKCRPVLITANDPATGLYNGDVGITMAVDGASRVWFPDLTGEPRAVSPARLPAHETAWAMTVHKAQGSEYEHVLLVLPHEDVQVLTRELLYTGITRAREKVRIAGTIEMLLRGTARTTRRASGLADRLTGSPLP